MTNEEIRLECMKFAHKRYHQPESHRGLIAFSDQYNREIPHLVTLLANKYFDYIKTGIPIEVETE